jgi:hypothetical protein
VSVSPGCKIFEAMEGKLHGFFSLFGESEETNEKVGEVIYEGEK